MDDVIDFADITNQINRREMGRVFEFNLMLVGTTGIGKSTLVKSLFQNMIQPEETMGSAKLNEYSELIEERGVKLKLRCIETSNFDSHNSDVYVKYLDDKLKEYFVAQQRQSSWNIHDTRVHCCLYMLKDDKMRLREEDIQCMKALHEKVNLVPIIAKADQINQANLVKFKENIRDGLKRNNINYFKFSHTDKEDEERSRAVKQEAERFPFAVVAADEPIMEGRKRVWYREAAVRYHIDIYDKDYDFDALAKLLIRHCMLNLIDSTHVKHYAKFKSELLANLEGLRHLKLEPYEVGRIQHDISISGRGDGARVSLKQQRAELERELQALRDKVQSLKLGVPSRQRPEPREKPPILREKPSIFRGTNRY